MLVGVGVGLREMAPDLFWKVVTINATDSYDRQTGFKFQIQAI